MQVTDPTSQFSCAIFVCTSYKPQKGSCNQSVDYAVPGNLRDLIHAQLHAFPSPIIMRSQPARFIARRPCSRTSHKLILRASLPSRRLYDHIQCPSHRRLTWVVCKAPLSGQAAALWQISTLLIYRRHSGALKPICSRGYFDDSQPVTLIS
jgi:hypothetical protein